MPFSVDYTTTDANFWRAVIRTGGGTKVAGFEITRTAITRREALTALSLIVRSLRPQLNPDDSAALLRSIESDIVNG